MFKKIIFIITALFVATTISAQAATTATPMKSSGTTTTEFSAKSQGLISRITPQISIVIASMNGKDAQDQKLKSKTGLGVGALLDLNPFNSNLVLETGLLYRSFGTTQNGADIGAPSNLNLSQSVDLSYLSIPIATKYYFSGRNGSSLYLRAGIIPSFIVSKGASVTMNGQTQSVNIDSVKMNSPDFALNPGIGYSFKVGPTSFAVLDLNYVYGLTKVNDDSDVKNTAFIITTGIGVSL